VVLGVLVGLTGALTMASLAGARRTATALPRLRVASNAADAVVFPSQVGALHPDWSSLRAQPEVKAVAVWDLLFGDLDGQPGALLFGADDEGFMGAVGRPVVVSGRMWDPTDPHEVVIDENASKGASEECGRSLRFGCAITVGSTFMFQPYGLDQGIDSDTSVRPDGPQLSMKVVGVVRTINQFLFVPDGQVFVSPAFVATYGEQVQTLENADVVLRNGASDIAALKRDMNELVAPGAPVFDLHAVSRRVDTTLSVERTALLLLAAVVAIAGGLLVAQALVRSAGMIGDDALVLRAIGVTRSQMVMATMLSHTPTAMVGVVVAIVGAVIGSQWLPVGLARRVDPDVGIHADLTVLLPGAVLVGVFVLAGVALVAARASHILSAGRTLRASTLAEAIRRRAPVSVGVGAGMAFERGRGPRSVPVGSAMLGAVVGVLGVVGTLTIDRGIGDSLAHPERAGVTWDATATTPPSTYEPTGLDPAVVSRVVAAAPDGTAVSIVDRQVINVGGVGVPTFAVRDNGTGKPNVALAVTSGRAPTADGEAAIGPATARDLHVGMGGSVAVGDRGESVRVVGIGLFPDDVHAEFDEGLWLTPAALDKIWSPPDTPDEGADYRTIALRFPPGTDVDATVAAIQNTMGDDVLIATASVPVELSNLRNVRTLPLLLAGFLALLAIAAVSHVLATSARRRRQDFAILRSIGLNRRSTRAVLNAQGTSIGLVGLLVGLPLGVVIGRTGWHVVANRVPLQDVPPFALLAVVLVVPVTVFVVNALAVWPGRHVARVRPAELLHVE
jgi:ABC-type lipoprotein release transport system permease subunit